MPGHMAENRVVCARLVFKRLPPPTDEDILRLTVRLSQRLGRIAKRRMQQVELGPLSANME